MNTRSLGFRMTTWLGALLTATLLLFAATVYFGVKQHLTKQLEQSLIEQAGAIGEELLVAVPTRGDQYAIAEINESYDPEVNGRFIRVTREDGRVLYHSKSPRDGSFDANAVAPVTGRDVQGYNPRTVEARGDSVIVQGLSYVAPDGSRFLIETGAPYRLIASELKSIRLAFALGIPVFLVVAALGGLLLVRKSLEPIRAISDQAERISSESISQRLPVAKTGDEIERLSLSLNRMIARLDESIRHISRFSADVSHELRTPLTILRGELEGMASEPGSSADTMETVGNALEEIERLTHIIDQLLIISRLDAGQAGMECSRVDLGVLAHSTSEQMRLLADEKEIGIRYAIEPETFVLGDPIRLKQVLVNLLDNAVKYTPEHGQIEVQVRALGPHALLSVVDNGIGISAEALPHVFERFYRADKARTRSSGGTGLGLSIVRAIVAAHDGTVRIGSEVGVGTTTQVELPLAAEERRHPSGRTEAVQGSLARA
jgi:heavy metal sensor kinase